MKKIVLVSVAVLISIFTFAQSPGKTIKADTSGADSALLNRLQQGVGLVGDSTIDISALQQSSMQQVFTLQTELQTQKFLKSIFLLGFIFMTLIVILLFAIYYIKIRQILKLIDIQEKEMKLRQFEVEKLSIIINNTMDAAAITDKNGKVLWANKSFERIYGVNPEMTEINLLETKDPDIEKLIEKCRKEHRAVQFTKEMVTEKGEKKWIQRRIIPLVNDKNEILNFAVIDTDYTALKLASEKNTDITK